MKHRVIFSEKKSYCAALYDSMCYHEKTATKKYMHAFGGYDIKIELESSIGSGNDTHNKCHNVPLCLFFRGQQITLRICTNDPYTGI